MRNALALLILILLLPTSPVSAQAAVAISSPAPGQILTGVVTVIGTSAVDGFISAELSFSYTGDTTGTWFQVAAVQPVTDGVLADWDTTTITDGNYNLRLRVTMVDGTFLDYLVHGLLIRNYTPTDTLVPTSTIPPTLTPILPTPTITPSPTATFTPTSTPLPTPTALPENPAILPSTEILTSILYGGLSATLLFILLVLYLRLRLK